MKHYQGTIINIQAGVLSVQINDETTCESCSSRKACCIAGREKKIIAVPSVASNYKIGDTVTVSARASMSWKAVLLSFILPLLTILVALVMASCMGIQEGYAATAALLFLAVYYLLLYFCRSKLKRQFTFTVQ